MPRTRRAPDGPHGVESIRQLIATNDKALERGIIVIYERQTADERNVRQTTEHNGRGFTGVDAEFLSSLAEWINSSRRPAGQRLSIGQRTHARRKMAKYAKQLATVANEKYRAEHPETAAPVVIEIPSALAACPLCAGSGRYDAFENSQWSEVSCPNGCTP